MRFGRQPNSLHRQDHLGRRRQTVLAPIHFGRTNVAGLGRSRPTGSNGHASCPRQCRFSAPVASITGPCSICSSNHALQSRGAGVKDPGLTAVRPAPGQPRRHCRRWSPVPRPAAVRPAATRLPIMAGRNRLPSSFIQLTTPMARASECRHHPAREQPPAPPARRRSRRSAHRWEPCRGDCQTPLPARPHPPARRRNMLPIASCS